MGGRWSFIPHGDSYDNREGWKTYHAGTPECRNDHCRCPVGVGNRPVQEGVLQQGQRVGQPLRSTRSAGLARRATGSRRCGIPVRASCPAGCPARCCDASTCRFSTGPRAAVGTSTRNGTGDRNSDSRYTLGSSVGSGPATTHTNTVLREPGSRRLRSSLRTVPCSGRAVSISTATVAFRAADTGRISTSATSGRVRTTRHCSTTDVDEWSSIRGRWHRSRAGR